MHSLFTTHKLTGSTVLFTGKVRYCILAGLAVISIIAIALFVTLPVKEKTYSYENASFPPSNTIGAYSDYFVNSVREASEIVGYTVSEPVLPDGTTLQLIGIHGDGVVQMYASPHPISQDTLDREFTYELQGLLIYYERLPDRLSHMDTNTLNERWATGENIDSTLKSNNRAEGVKEISIGQGHSGTFDMPEEIRTSISNDVLVNISSFYDGSTLKSVLTD